MLQELGKVVRKFIWRNKWVTEPGYLHPRSPVKMEESKKPNKCSGEAWPVLHSIRETESWAQTWLLGGVGLGTWRPPRSHTVTMEGNPLPYVFLLRTDRRLTIVPILETSLIFREVKNSLKLTISHGQPWESNWVCSAAMNPKPDLFSSTAC